MVADFGSNCFEMQLVSIPSLTKMNLPKRRAGTGPGRSVGRLPGAVAVDALDFEDPYADEVWETACYEGNRSGAASLRELGYQWFKGVTPPN